jgi:hypothetical protein
MARKKMFAIPAQKPLTAMRAAEADTANHQKHI